MQSAKITFSDGSTMTVSATDCLIPIVKYDHNGETLTSQDKVYEIWYHVHDGLIPSLTELLCKCEFFKQIDGSKVYKTSSVVSVENL